MEWLVLMGFVAIAAALVALPKSRAGVPGQPDEGQLLSAERRMLLAELRELDDDALVGRISADDRQAGRRALAPRLRAVTESLRARGELDTTGSAR